MKYLYILVLVAFLFSCKSAKIVNDVDSRLNRTIPVLSSQDKRKFDYFFYEGQRFKMNGNLGKAKNYFIECLKIDSLSAVSYFELANIAIAAQNYQGAQDLLANSVRISPNNKWYQILLGDLYQQNKEIDKAIYTYNNLVKNFPDSDEFIYVLAQLYTQNKEFDKAIETYNKLEANIGLNEVITLEKERILLELGKESLAIKEINNLIEDNPYEPRYYGFLGDLYLYNKDFKKAEESYKKILEIDSKNGLGYFSLANLSIKQKDTVNFINYFKKGIEDSNLAIDIKLQRLMPFLLGREFKNGSHEAEILDFFKACTLTHNDDARSHIYYANFLKNKNKKAEALESYKNAIAIDNENISYWQDMFFLQIELSKFEELYTDSKDALIIFPDEPLLNLFNGMAAMQLNKPNKAVVSLEHGIKFVKENNNLKGQFYAYLGDVYYTLNKYNESFKSYDNALSLNENNVIVLNNYSYYLSLQNVNLEKAEKMISKCIELESDNYTYLDTYAWVLFKRGRYFEAKYIIERAIDSGGSESDVIVEHYGDILFKNNDIDGAVKQWKLSLEMGNKSETLPLKIEQKRYVEE